MHFILFVFKMLMGKNGFYFINVHYNFELSFLKKKTFADFPSSSSHSLVHEHADTREHITQPQSFSPVCLHNFIKAPA